MENLQRIRAILEDLGFQVKICENIIVASSPKEGEILVKIGTSKPQEAIDNKKIVVISPFIAKKIDKDILKKMLEMEDKILFINKNTLEKIYPLTFFKIVNYLKENPNSYISKISRDLNLHPEKVRRALISMQDYIEVKTFEDKHLPKLPKLISLRKELNEEEIRKIASTKIRIISSKKKRRKIRYIRISKEEALPLIVKFIENNPGTHLRDISRKLKINPAIVHQCLKEISEFIEISIPSKIENLNLPNIPGFLRIKDGYNAEGILRVLRIKNMLNKTNS